MAIGVYELKRSLNKAKDEKEQYMLIKKALMGYKTDFTHNYSDFDQSEFYESIKIYKADNYNYIMTVNNYDKLKTASVLVALFSKKPSRPHELFPILKPCIREAIFVKTFKEL